LNSSSSVSAFLYISLFSLAHILYEVEYRKLSQHYHHLHLPHSVGSDCE